MDIIKKIDPLVLKATNDQPTDDPQSVYKQILQIINSRADMPKHVIASISKRMTSKNKVVWIKIFTLLQYLTYECELSLYSQICTKEFLFKISGLLMNKETDPEVKTKAMETIFCWEQLFRPHQDLLPLFFQFYAGMLRSGFDIPHDYKSKFRPAQLKQYKKHDVPSSATRLTDNKNPYGKQITAPTVSEQKTFQQIRQKLILTNEIIDNANPSDSVKQNGLLLQMIEQVKQCQKKVNKTINQNPNEKIMEMALAANDDIFITYRRFKDLQRNKKPEPFLLTQLASDLSKEQDFKKSQIQKTASNASNTSQKIQPTKKQVNILDFDAPTSPSKIQKKSSLKNQNLMDFDIVPQPVKQPQGNIFDLLDGPSASIPQPAQSPTSFSLLEQTTTVTTTSTYQVPINQMPINQPPPTMGTFDDLLITTQNYQGLPAPSGFGINLNANDFRTEADIKNYNNKSAIDKLEDLTYQFLKK